MFPVNIPASITADVHFLLVSPAVFWTCHVYIRGEIRAGGHDVLRGAPKQNHSGQQLSSWKPDKRDSGNRLHNELCEIEDAFEPRRLIAQEVGVLD